MLKDGELTARARLAIDVLRAVARELADGISSAPFKRMAARQQ